MLMKLCNHPSLVAEDDNNYGGQQTGRRAGKQQVKYSDGDETTSAAPGADGIAKFLPFSAGGGGRGKMGPVHPEWSGKMFLLFRLMKEMRRPGNGNDKIVIITNYSTDKENETPSPSKKEWECSSCTLFNKQSYRKCKACGTKRPNSAADTKKFVHRFCQLDLPSLLLKDKGFKEEIRTKLLALLA